MSEYDTNQIIVSCPQRTAVRAICYIIRLMENIDVGDLVVLKKTHPCGGREWKVVRLGADIGLECLTCGHKIFLSRRDLAKRIKGAPIHPEDQNLPTDNTNKGA